MKAVAKIAAIAGIVAANKVVDDTPFVTKQHVAEIKSSVNFETYSHDEHPFANYTVAELKARLGAHIETSNKDIVYGDMKLNAELPESFDSRTQWPGCIGEIRNQGSCGSCWAFAATGVLADRACISGQTKGHVVMSPQQLVSCDTQDYGCNGGYLDKSWDYVQTHGAVTETCYPYTSGTTQQTGSCMTKFNRCKKDSGLAREEFVQFKVADYRQHDTIVAAKEAIVKRGPIEAGFIVYSDFMSYKGGLYEHKTGGRLGGHAVKVIGFGVEDICMTVLT